MTRDRYSERGGELSSPRRTIARRGFLGALVGVPHTQGTVDSPAGVVQQAGRAAPERPADVATHESWDASYVAAAGVDAADTSFMSTDQVLHGLRRFTFGLTPELVSRVRGVGLGQWFGEQLNPGQVPDELADRVWAAFPMAGMTTPEIMAAIAARSTEAQVQHYKAVLGRQLWSERQLYEVMVDFWANHLNVPMPNASLWHLAGPYHNEVIRPNALGKFRTMLLAAMRHPAMLRYLSNDVSRKESVNENLGRELLELHTVGVNGGYTETDVRNSAYILTGRTIGANGLFTYAPARHYVGTVTVLGFTDPNATAEGGLAVGDRYLTYLANHPKTARYIARKLAVRFVSDSPPPTLVDGLAQVYLNNDTAIRPLLTALLNSAEFKASIGAKVRRPLENTTATVRALGSQPAAANLTQGVTNLVGHLTQVGHRPLGWQPPNGYPDVAAAWNSAGSMLKQWNLHRRLATNGMAGLAHPGAGQLVSPVPADVDGYLDALSVRLLQQKLTDAHRAALRAFLGSGVTTGAQANQQAAQLAALILDSAYFALR